MATPLTNHELYVRLMAVAKTHASQGRSLEEYLRALLHRCTALNETAELTVDMFVSVLTSSFSGPTFPYCSSWERNYAHFDDEAGGFEGLEACLVKQIVDLRDMESNGQLDDEMNYFGITSPRGNRWYNFVPIAYIECGLAGTFGCRGTDVREVQSIVWDDISYFAWAGQSYE